MGIMKTNGCGGDCPELSKDLGLETQRGFHEVDRRLGDSSLSNRKAISSASTLA